MLAVTSTVKLSRHRRCDVVVIVTALVTCVAQGLTLLIMLMVVFTLLGELAPSRTYVQKLYVRPGSMVAPGLCKDRVRA